MKPDIRSKLQDPRPNQDRAQKTEENGGKKTKNEAEKSLAKNKTEPQVRNSKT